MSKMHCVLSGLGLTLGCLMYSWFATLLNLIKKDQTPEEKNASRGEKKQFCAYSFSACLLSNAFNKVWRARRCGVFQCFINVMWIGARRVASRASEAIKNKGFLKRESVFSVQQGFHFHLRLVWRCRENSKKTSASPFDMFPFHGKFGVSLQFSVPFF